MRVEGLIQSIGHPYWITYLGFTPDGRKLISACRSFTKCWDRETGKLHWTLRNKIWLWEADITSDGRLILRADEVLDFVEIESGRVIDTLTGNFDFTNDVKVNPNGKTFAVITQKEILKEKGMEFLNHLQIRDLKTKEILWEQKVEQGGCVSFTPDGKRIIYAEGKTIKIFDAETGKEIKSFKIHEGLKAHFCSIDISPDGKILLGEMILYHVENGKLTKREEIVSLIDFETERVLKTFANSISAVFSPNGKTVVLGKIGEIVFIDLHTLEEIKILKSTLSDERGRKGFAKIFSLSFSPDGKYLAAGSLGIELWDVGKDDVIWEVEPAERGEFIFCSQDFFILITDTKIFRYSFEDRNLKKIIETNGFIKSSLFNQKTGLLACGTRDKQVLIIDTNRAEVIKKIVCPTFVESLAFSDNKKTLVAGCFGTVVLIDIKTWQSSEIPLGKFCPSAMTFRNNSLLGGYLNEKSEFILENITDHKVVRNFGKKVSCFAFSCDGKILAVGKSAGAVEIVDTETGLTESSLKVKEPSTLKFLSHNLLACGTFEGNVLVFNLENNDLILKLPAHIGFVSSIDLSNDGKYMLSTGEDGVVVRYDFTL